MKNIKRIAMFIIMLFMFGIIGKVNAITVQSFTLTRPGDLVEYGGSNAPSTPLRYRLKYASGTNYLAFCTSEPQSLTYDGSTYTTPGTGLYGSIDSNAKRVGVASLIKDGVGDKATNSSVSSYMQYRTQIAIWQYLGYGSNTIDGSATVDTMATLITNDTGNYNGTNINTMITNANKKVSDYNNDYKIDLTATVLNFTKQSNGDYKSQEVSISSASGIDLSTNEISITSNKGTVTRNGNSFSITVPASQVTENASTTVIVTVTRTTDVYYANNYYSSSGQNLTLTALEKSAVSRNKSISGVITSQTPTPTPTSGNYILKIKKTNADTGDAVGNTKFGIYIKNANGSYTFGGERYSLAFEQWYRPAQSNITGVTRCIDASNLHAGTGDIDGENYCVIPVTTPGTYCLLELEAPSGYYPNTSAQCATLSDSQPVIELSIADTPRPPGGGGSYPDTFSITILKKTPNGDKLPGASFKIEDSNGNTIKSFTTTNQDIVIDGLIQGQTYTIIEIEAPNGYAKAGDIKITYGSNGLQLISGDAEILGNTVIITDGIVVDVPATGISNIILTVLGLTLLIGGAGFIGYGVYRNRKESQI